MRFRAPATLLLSLTGGLAWGQASNTTVVVPPAPAIVSAPLASPAPVSPPASPPPPGLVQVQPPPASTATTTTAGGSSTTGTPATTADTAPITQNDWVTGTIAQLGVLDKVDGSTAKVSIPVGSQAKVGDLQVSVQSCVNRPPGQLPDTAIFLTVQPLSDTSSPPLFRGWMVRSTPGATAVGDAGETFRVIGCS